MIKHFNTAFAASNNSTPKSGKGGMMGTVVMIALLAGAVWFGYKYIQSRNQPVVRQEEE
jgi:hypothetical protein